MHPAGDLPTALVGWDAPSSSRGLDGQMPSRPTSLLVAPASVDVSPVKSILGSVGFDTVVPTEATGGGLSVLDHLLSAVEQSDCVVAMLDGTHQAPQFFALGYAFRAGKPICIIASPDVEIPIELAGVFRIVARGADREPIRFGLTQFVNNLSSLRPTLRQQAPANMGGNPAATRLLQTVRGWKAPPTEFQLMRVLDDVLRSSGATVVAEPVQEDGSRPDFIVWSRDLEPWVGNPLVIEAKTRCQTREDLVAAATQVFRYLAVARGTWGLVIYHTGPPPDTDWRGIPYPVLFIGLEDLLNALAAKSFGMVVRELRNRAAHGLRP